MMRKSLSWAPEQCQERGFLNPGFLCSGNNSASDFSAAKILCDTIGMCPIYAKFLHDESIESDDGREGY
jgi:hypothetical protein